jgi:UDP-glucose 4-epimerase
MIDDLLLSFPNRDALRAEPRFAAVRGTRALVTGGAGFVGSNLVHALEALGCSVVVLDSLAPEQGGNLFNLAGLEGTIDMRISDIRDAAAVADAVQGADFVFNLAGGGAHLNSLDAPFEDLDVNLRGTLVVLEAVRQHAPAARVVFGGSRGEYGAILHTPVAEDHPLRPTEVNSANKAAAALYHFTYHVSHGLDTVTLRLANVYGPRMQAAHPRQGFIAWFVRSAVQGGDYRLYGDGSQVRDMVYIDDTVSALLLAAVTPGIAGEALNVGSGEPSSLRQIAEELVEIAGAGRIEYVPFPEDARRIEIGDYVADTTKIKGLLDWRPQVSIREGLERSVRYYRAYKEHYW